MSRGDSSAAVGRVLEQLDRVKRSGDGWTARCPAHDDRSPSLGVDIGSDGRVLITCHAGCSLAAILAALGLEERDLFDEPRGARRIVEMYDYVDEEGRLLYQAVRYEPKDFRQRRPDGNGDWIWKLGDTRRVLYRLPEVRAVAAIGEPIYVVEGEKDVHALDHVLDFAGAATTAAMGAGKWRDEYAEQLRGASLVAIIPDDDEPGRQHADQVAASLARAGIPVKVVELWPAGETHRDFSDFLASTPNGAGPEQARAALEAIVERTPLWQPPQSEPQFRGRSHSEVLAMTFEPQRDLVDDLVPAGAVGAIVGLPEVGKGWLAQAIAVGVASGEGEILGRNVVRQGPVGYFWQDDSTRAEAERIQTYARVRASPADLPITWFLNEGLQLPRDLDELRATVERLNLVLCFIDSFYNVADVDLKERDAGKLYAALKAQVADPTGCTVIPIDHMPWATDTNRGRLRGYGDVFKGAAARFGIYIDADRDKLWIEARGNNITGFKRTLAYWDADRLELRLVDTTTQDESNEALDARVLEWLEQHTDPQSTTKVREGVGGRGSRVDAALERLKDRAEVNDHGRDGGPWAGENGKPRYWIARIHAEQTTAPLFGPGSAEVASGGSESETSATPSHPRRGDEVERAEVESGLPARPDVVGPDAAGMPRAEAAA